MGGVRYEKRDKIAVISFHWREPHGPPSREVEQQLGEAVSDFTRDPACLAAVLTGSGPTFCGEWSDARPFMAEALEGFGHFAKVFPFSDMEKPVIAAVNGEAVGRGFELALDCDIRIASDTAAFALGSPRDDRRVLYMAQVLPRLIPFGEAMRLLLSNLTLTALEAKRIGLVQEVVPAERLMDRAVALANTIALTPPQGLRATKKVALFWRNLMLSQSYELVRSIMRP